VLALLTRSFGQGALAATIRSPYPSGRKQRAVSTLPETCTRVGLQSIVDGSFPPFPGHSEWQVSGSLMTAGRVESVLRSAE
jgi:hypothetical protein